MYYVNLLKLISVKSDGEHNSKTFLHYDRQILSGHFSMESTDKYCLFVDFWPSPLSHQLRLVRIINQPGNQLNLSFPIGAQCAHLHNKQYTVRIMIR